MNDAQSEALRHIEDSLVLLLKYFELHHNPVFPNRALHAHERLFLMPLNIDLHQDVRVGEVRLNVHGGRFDLKGWPWRVLP